MEIKDLGGDDIKVHRFFCGCGSAQHVLEICIDGQVMIDYYHGRCNFTLWERIKVAFEILFRNYERPWSDFIIREDDREEIASLICQKK